MSSTLFFAPSQTFSSPCFSTNSSFFSPPHLSIILLIFLTTFFSLYCSCLEKGKVVNYTLLFFTFYSSSIFPISTFHLFFFSFFFLLLLILLLLLLLLLLVFFFSFSFIFFLIFRLLHTPSPPPSPPTAPSRVLHLAPGPTSGFHCIPGYFERLKDSTKRRRLRW